MKFELSVQFNQESIKQMSVWECFKNNFLKNKIRGYKLLIHL